jgi:PA14 domain-containing protein
MTMKNPSGSVVGLSSSFDNNVEAVFIRPTVTGTYKMSITRPRCDSTFPNTRIGAAWSEGPNPYTGQYFNNTTLSGAPVLTRKDPKIGFDWGNGDPSEETVDAIHADGFSARWTKTENFAAGTYAFRATGDDGIRLYIDGAKLIDAWKDQPARRWRRLVAPE